MIPKNSWKPSTPPPPQDDHQSDHVDEKWLVSYADMMTLLFGLFVILFSISSENQEEYQRNLKMLSSSTTKTEMVPDKEIPEIKLQLEAEKLKLAQALLEIEKLNRLVQSTKSESQTSAAETDRQNQLRELDQKTIDSLKAKVDQLTSENRSLVASLSASSTSSKTEVLKSLQKIQELEAKLKAMEATETELSKKIVGEDLLNQKLKQAKLAEDSLRAQLDQLARDKANLERQVDSAKSQDRKLASIEAAGSKSKLEVDQQKQKIDQLTAQMADLQKEVSRLMSELKESEKKGADGQGYLFFIVKWTSEKHDLDLTVTNPQGKQFDFKKRSFAGIPGSFSLDSRTGPGAEIWQASNPEPGIYTIQVKMYNNYGNAAPADVSGSILSNKSSLVIPASKVESKSGSILTFKVQLDSKGSATLQ